MMLVAEYSCNDVHVIFPHKQSNPTDLMVKAQQASKPIAAAMTWDSSQTDIAMPSLFSSDEHRKKKYAKESWPGKKPAHLLI